jgi:hypothetical protein
MLRVASLFSQLLKEFPRDEFEVLVKAHAAEKNAKGFTCWTQFVAMLFCQIARADSLREICNGLTCCLGKLVHLGVSKAPNKSTLSYANTHRPAALFESIFWKAMERFREKEAGIGTRKAKFRFRNKLLSMDATVISLCLSMYPWATFRRRKGAVKMHLVLDHDDYMPSYALVTEGGRHEATIAKTLLFSPGSIVAMDRGYNDYTLFGRWTERGVYFVTRKKDNAIFKVVEERTVPQNRNILSDQIIQLTGAKAYEKCPFLLRLIVVWDAVKEREIALLTNHLDFGATTISAIYKDRWEIELFFKAIKQNLKVKTFVGISENALLIQIWTALIAMLLLKWLHHRSKAGWSLSNMFYMLIMNLFTYRDLYDWLDDPFKIPPIPPAAQQLSFVFPYFG